MNCGLQPASADAVVQTQARLTMGDPRKANFFKKYIIIYVCGVFACLSVPDMHDVPKDSKRGHRIPWSWSYRRCESPCGCWESNPGPLGEQAVLLLGHLSSLTDFLKK